jgi:branched-chain amino acid transport system permease protein
MQLFIQQVVNGLISGSSYAVVALGYGLVFSVMRVMNMAHPDVAMLGAYSAYLVTSVLSVAILGLPTALLLLVFLGLLLVGGLTGAVSGLILERLVIRPSLGKAVLVSFIATAGIGIALENGVTAIFGSLPVQVPSVLPTWAILVAGIRFTPMELATLVISCAMMVGLRYYVHGTKWGLATRAMADRSDVAAACGVNTRTVSMLTMGISSAMAGVAGVTIALSQTQASPFMGLALGLKSFVCMLVGGNRHIEGILAIGLLLGVAESLISGYLSTDYRDAVAFALMLVVLLVRPNGLFGSYPTHA